MYAKMKESGDVSKMMRLFMFLILGIVFIFSVCTVWAKTEPAAYNPLVTESEKMRLPLLDSVETPVEVQTITDEEIRLIAQVVQAEAEGECEEGKRMVIDVILNRKDSEHFPDTVHDVIYQPRQFSVMWNGRFERCGVREDICQMVRQELVSRRNHDVIFFNAGGYSKYGVPMFQVENHYFSSYD